MSTAAVMHFGIEQIINRMYSLFMLFYLFFLGLTPRLLLGIDIYKNTEILIMLILNVIRIHGSLVNLISR